MSRSKKPASVNTALTPKLEQTLAVGKDLTKQPETPYILITSLGSGRPIYYAVDGWRQDGPIIMFMRKSLPVYVCRTREGQWAIVARDAVNFCTEKDLMTFTLKDSQAQADYYKKLDPEGFKQAQEEAAAQAASPFAVMMPRGEGHTHSSQPQMGKQDERPTPGQYL
jgi:hypothetical protein